MRAFWVTFYSYKGGVGRSTALANVAGLLAQQGRRVLMVDFDLEAPGLDSFEEFQLETNQPGLVEYVSAYLDSGKVDAIAPYVHTVNLPETTGGKLWLLPAGRKDQAYNRKRSAINWSAFFEENDGALFFENFKADVEDTFRPDFVFIDSRTGLTDVGGICTALLPNMVVLLFALNEQNLRGIASVARVLETSENSPQLLPVATPVPNLPRSSASLVDERFVRAREILGMEPKITIHYVPEVSLRERVYALSESDDRNVMTVQYQQLKEAIVEAAPEGLDYLIQQASDAVNNFDPERSDEIRKLLEEAFSDRADAWYWHAELSRTLGDLEAYARDLQKALDLSPNHDEAYAKLYGFLNAKKQWEELEGVMHGLLAKGSLLKKTKREAIEQELGLLFMLNNRHADAYPYFLNLLRSLSEPDHPAATRPAVLIATFNMLESARRAEIRADSGWESLVQLFESSLTATATDSIPSRLQRMQAMHVAYACSGKIHKAKELLSEVEKLALQLSPKERLFCVSVYNPISRDEFLENNRKMLKALAKGQLWDGYPVPAK